MSADTCAQIENRDELSDTAIQNIEFMDLAQHLMEGIVASYLSFDVFFSFFLFLIHRAV